MALLQYNLDFRGLSPRGRNASPGNGDDNGAGASTLEGGKTGGGGGGDPGI